MQHSFEIVSTKAISPTPLSNSGIDITNYIPARRFRTVTVTPNQTGNFFYVCTVPSTHITRHVGKRSSISTTSPTPTIPEFPSALTLMFVALAITAMAAFVARQKIKPNNYIKSNHNSFLILFYANFIIADT